MQAASLVVGASAGKADRKLRSIGVADRPFASPARLSHANAVLAALRSAVDRRRRRHMGDISR